MTFAFSVIGCRAIGVDYSAAAIQKAERVLPQIRGQVHLLGRGELSLSKLPNDLVDLVLAKDVLEHIPEDGGLPDIVEHLMCIGRQVLAVIPTTDEAGNFVCKLYEQDETHVTRFTKDVWLGLFPCATACELPDLTRQIRSSKRQAQGTLSLLLEEDPEWRRLLMKERLRAQSPMWRQLLGLRPRDFKLDFNSLYQPSEHKPRHSWSSK